MPTQGAWYWAAAWPPFFSALKPSNRYARLWFMLRRYGAFPAANLSFPQSDCQKCRPSWDMLPLGM